MAGVSRQFEICIVLEAVQGSDSDVTEAEVRLAFSYAMARIRRFSPDHRLDWLSASWTVEPYSSAEPRPRPAARRPPG